MKKLLLAMVLFSAVTAQAAERRTEVSSNDGDAVFVLVWDDVTMLATKLCGTIQVRSTNLPGCMAIARGGNAQGAQKAMIVPDDATEHCLDIDQQGANSIPLTLNQKGKPEGYSDRTDFQGKWPYATLNPDPLHKCQDFIE